MRLRLLPLLLAIAFVAGCAGTLEEDDPTEGLTDGEIYANAKQELDTGDYPTAIDLYERLEARYPYGPYAEQARLEVAYGYYKNHEPESAIVAADRFIKLHPRHPNVDYAYYLRGLATFDQSDSFLFRFFRQNIHERDARVARESFQYFSEVAERFPTSRYAADSIARMVHLRNRLAEYELFVADYYMRRGAYLAAANRGKYVLETYPNTPSVKNALEMMIGAYQSLGLGDLAADAQRVWELNFKASQPQAQGAQNNEAVD